MPHVHDVVVVGAGPAGLAVALGAARRGMDVVILERRSGAIDKACGEGLMPSAVKALHRLGIDPPGMPIHGIRYCEKGLAAAATFRAGPGRGVRRTALHRSLTDAAEAAGVTVLQHNLVRVTQRSGHVEADHVRARYLVAADGLHSAIRDAVGLAAPRQASPRWGQRRHVCVPLDTPFVEVHWSPHAEAYVTPVAPDTTGVAILSSIRAPYDEQLAMFPALRDRLHGAEVASAVLGAGPLRQRVAGRVAGRVLLVGDAAGYVDALTGEGIGVALAAAERLVACLAAGRPLDYDAAWRQVTRRSRALTQALLWTRGHERLRAEIVPLASQHRRTFAAVVDALA